MDEVDIQIGTHFKIQEEELKQTFGVQPSPVETPKFTIAPAQEVENLLQAADHQEQAEVEIDLDEDEPAAGSGSGD